jgi:hypothetical protein
MNCQICKGLEEIYESRISEYARARSAAYYQVSTELAAYKNVENGAREERVGKAPVRVRLRTQKRDSQHTTLGGAEGI